MSLSLLVVTYLWEVWEIGYSIVSCDCLVSVGGLDMYDRGYWGELLGLVLYIQTCSMCVNKRERE